jgi:hypothetical protein
LRGGEADEAIQDVNSQSPNRLLLDCFASLAMTAVRCASTNGISCDDEALTLAPSGRGCRDEVATGEGSFALAGADKALRITLIRPASQGTFSRVARGEAGQQLNP